MIWWFILGVLGCAFFAGTGLYAMLTDENKPS